MLRRRVAETKHALWLHSRLTCLVRPCCGWRRYDEKFALQELKDLSDRYEFLAVGARQGAELDGARAPLALGAVAPRDIVVMETEGNNTNEHNDVYW